MTILKKILSISLCILMLASALPFAALKTGAATVTDVAFDDIVKAAADVIRPNEGDYSSVNPNDNGAVSIGWIQWHAGRALSLMRTIVDMDRAKAKELLRIFDLDARPVLTDAENALFRQAKATYMARMKTGCTGCRYCQPCPMGVQIPRIFQGYDGSRLHAEPDFKGGYARIAAEEGDASRCVQCGQCESNCPQHLSIIQYLQEIHADSTK